MKKINLLFTIPALIVPTTLIFTNCSGVRKLSFIIDETVSEQASLTMEYDEQQNAVCNISLKEELIQKNKISSVKVQFEKTDLDEDEYKVEFVDSNENAKVTIYKSTLDSKKGTYTFIPSIVAKQFNGIIAQLKDKHFYVDDCVTIDDITVYQSLEGTKGDIIDWSEDIKVYHEGEPLINFSTSGMLLPEASNVTLTLKYNEFSTDVVINVEQK